MQNRKQILSNINNSTFVNVVIGGGATGSAIALDSASRGFATLLLEQADFGSGTSSKSTKILHGGVRYLAQGNIKLVYNALHEKMRLYNNAPHVCYPLDFVIPSNNFFSTAFYGAGMFVYDILAGFKLKYLSKWLFSGKMAKYLPNLNSSHNKYGIMYNDGQFDDARLNITAINSVIQHKGIALNYCKVTGFVKNANQKITGVHFTDTLTNTNYTVNCSVVFNATGVFTDEVNKLNNNPTDNVTLAQGIHLVVDAKAYNSSKAVLIPKTTDGRVLFCIPWYNKVIIGTTDTLINKPTLHPKPLPAEVTLILQNVNTYLKTNIQCSHVHSIYAGIRPLIKNNSATAKISREEKITIDNSNLISIIGGKWTTFRHMGQKAIDFAISNNLLPNHKCNTLNLQLNGYVSHAQAHKIPTQYRFYGNHYHSLKQISGFGTNLHADLPICKAQVIWALQNEHAHTLEDILARRTRCLFLNAQATMQIAPTVVQIMQQHLGQTDSWAKTELQNFNQVANLYLPSNYF